MNVTQSGAPELVMTEKRGPPKAEWLRTRRRPSRVQLGVPVASSKRHCIATLGAPTSASASDGCSATCWTICNWGPPLVMSLSALIERPFLLIWSSSCCRVVSVFWASRTSKRIRHSIETYDSDIISMNGWPNQPKKKNWKPDGQWLRIDT